MDQGGGDDLHVRVETGVQGVPQMALNDKILVDSPEDIQTDGHGGGGAEGGGVEDENVRPGNPKIQIFHNIPTMRVDGG